MRVFIMRHGEASFHADSDPARRLTERGVEQTADMTRRLREQSDGIEFVLVSPYVRAQQTLEVVRREFPLPSAVCIETFPALIPGGSPAPCADYLTVLAQQGIGSVLIVSHLPLVSYLVSELSQGSASLMFPTSAVACVELDAQTARGRFEWMMAPGI
ncbi:phosphohistidine phosphatase [Leminorella grimontii]|uniref:Phosphohistidine phosphatase n=1 Tax=Leminorella grimontii TaxID=82981 RepID=A0AAV5N8B2_9GAMM|nr:phosphohistidine phosphatase SixA [Leminorella grimontii]KFC97155.1 phosphohistidine phosphatase [Leminorella grimontii ATCC 33999 = DSM 5078]GKX57001.1 phosphohistidine phosphatase [Leminorella grimontii]VFS57357.1 Phosphohistidine phosphatase sixA [Leminorella grimontii]